MTAEMCLQEQDAIAFVRVQQENASEESRLQHDADAVASAADHQVREESQRAGEHELKFIRLRIERQPNPDNGKAIKVPELPCLIPKFEC